MADGRKGSEWRLANRRRQLRTRTTHHGVMPKPPTPAFPLDRALPCGLHAKPRKETFSLCSTQKAPLQCPPTIEGLGGPIRCLSFGPFYYCA